MKPCKKWRRQSRSKRWLCLLFVLVGGSNLIAQTWAERLGYPKGRRVIILHADDIGMCYEANEAAKNYLENDQIQSASLMVPCPWFNEIAAWYRENPRHDLGLHLTLTSEWKHYRWGPTAPISKVPGLIDDDGYLWRTVKEVATHATAAEVELEIRAQLDRARSRGIEPGHLDTHMGTLFARPDFTKAYLKVAMEHEIPAMVIELTPEVVAEFRRQGYPMSDEMIEIVRAYRLPKLDAFYSVPRGKTYDEVVTGFLALLKDKVKPGITEIIFHPSTESEGLRKITGSWRQRSWEARMFADPRVIKACRRGGVVFTDWKEMMKRFRKLHGGKTK